MSITLELTPEQEARVRAAAARHGLAEEEYIRRLIDEHTPPPTQYGRLWDTLSPGEWIRETHEWIDERRDLPPLPDEALSREGMYEDERP